MIAAVERRFQAPEGAAPACMALREWQRLYRQADHTGGRFWAWTCFFTPVRSPQSNGMAEVLVKALKRDYVSTAIFAGAGTILALLTRMDLRSL